MAMTTPVEDSVTILVNTLEQVEYRETFLTKKQSECDKLLVDIDHYLELESLTLVESTKLLDLRVETLRKRREVKDEIKLLQDLRGIISVRSKRLGNWLNETIDKRSQRKYTKREKTLSDILN